MRIGSNFHLPSQPLTGFVAAFLCVFGSCISAPAAAQQAASAAVPSAVAVPTAPAPATTVQPITVGGDPAAAPGTPGAAAATKESIAKSMAKVEDKLIESAKADVKKLDNVPDETTLSELNRVRQTISRIEAMIDVEKRLNELEKLRNDRNKVGGLGGLPGMPGNLAEAIPASALSIPRGGAGVQAMGSSSRNSKEPKVFGSSSSSRRPTLQRIAGASGKYTAVIKTGDEMKSVRIGDKVSDGEYVRSITSSSVEIGGKGSSYTLHVKNVEMVHSIVR